ncbi:MAG: hypothetical protein JW797_01835 [Bradymonadales bacterium]|nr:hypothetical protein [Bradymonadales bacterium]
MATTSPHQDTRRTDRWQACLAGLLCGLGALLACPACSGSQQSGNSDQPEGDSPVDYPQIALDCLDLLSSYREVNLETASEAELERQMEEALLNQEICEQAFRRSYDGPGGQVMGNHLARSLELHALRVELALSARFDRMAGYCGILEELVRLLRADLAEIAEAVGSSRTREQDRNTLLSLQELTVQSIQMLLLDYQESCR